MYPQCSDNHVIFAVRLDTTEDHQLHRHVIDKAAGNP